MHSRHPFQHARRRAEAPPPVVVPTLAPASSSSRAASARPCLAAQVSSVSCPCVSSRASSWAASWAEEFSAQKKRKKLQRGGMSGASPALLADMAQGNDLASLHAFLSGQRTRGGTSLAAQLERDF